MLHTIVLCWRGGGSDDDLIKGRVRGVCYGKEFFRKDTIYLQSHILDVAFRYMKNVIKILALFIIITPLAVSAAWWNPLSWFDGWSFISKKEKNTEVSLLEQKIKELEGKIESSTQQENINPEPKKAEPSELKNPTQDKVVYVEKPIYIETKKETESVKVDESLRQETVSDVSIGYSYISQGTFKTDYGEYGSVLLGIRISTTKDIYIPQTTTDSSGENIGFSYSIEGANFVGKRLSDVGCTLVSDGYCKIKAGTVNKEITVNVWLYPENPGEYSLNFKKLGYKFDPKGAMNYLNINKIAEPLYIDY